jgi:hypothetical protein
VSESETFGVVYLENAAWRIPVSAIARLNATRTLMEFAEVLRDVGAEAVPARPKCCNPCATDVPVCGAQEGQDAGADSEPRADHEARRKR